MSYDLSELERLLREATPGPWVELEGHPYLFANPRGPQPWHHDIVGRFDYHSEINRPLIAALRNAAPELIRDARRYRELLFAVANKYPNETRHETALRCIRERETPSINTAKGAIAQERKG